MFVEAETWMVMEAWEISLKQEDEKLVGVE